MIWPISCSPIIKSRTWLSHVLSVQHYTPQHRPIQSFALYSRQSALTDPSGTHGSSPLVPIPSWLEEVVSGQPCPACYVVQPRLSRCSTTSHLILPLCLVNTFGDVVSGDMTIPRCLFAGSATDGLSGLPHTIILLIYIVLFVWRFYGGANFFFLVYSSSCTLGSLSAFMVEFLQPQVSTRLLSNECLKP